MEMAAVSTIVFRRMTFSYAGPADYAAIRGLREAEILRIGIRPVEACPPSDWPSLTTAIPQIADDLLHRRSRPSRAH